VAAAANRERPMIAGLFVDSARPLGNRTAMLNEAAELLDNFPERKLVGVKRGGQTSPRGGEMTKQPLISLVELTRIERATS
jgi:hypothetical protein